LLRKIGPYPIPLPACISPFRFLRPLNKFPPQGCFPISPVFSPIVLQERLKTTLLFPLEVLGFLEVAPFSNNPCPSALIPRTKEFPQLRDGYLPNASKVSPVAPTPATLPHSRCISLVFPWVLSRNRFEPLVLPSILPFVLSPPFAISRTSSIAGALWTVRLFPEASAGWPSRRFRPQLGLFIPFFFQSAAFPERKSATPVQSCVESFQEYVSQDSGDILRMSGLLLSSAPP